MTAGDTNADKGAAPVVGFRNKRLDLVRDPFAVVEQVGQRYPGQVVRLNLPGKPLLAHDPEHVRQVLGDPDIYARGGPMWENSARLQGNGILGEGAQWKASRAVIGPKFTGPAIRVLMHETIETIHDSIDELARRIESGNVVNHIDEMMTITRRVLGRAFLGGRIPEDDSAAIARAVNAAFGAMAIRLVAPVPLWFPLPGDRTVRRCIRLIDNTLYPYIARARDEAPTWDVLSALAHARDGQGNPWPADVVARDMISMFLAGTETTAHTLVWWAITLDRHPDIAARVEDEILTVVGARPLAAEHYRDLTYLRATFKEVLRLYPVGWMLPRQAQRDDVLGGVPVRAGETVIACPYLTHRDPRYWPDPLTFDPSRWLHEGRPPEAYIPFAVGPHRCIGEHFFGVESTLIAAALVSRFTIRVRVRHPVRPKLSASLRPGRNPLLELHPRYVAHETGSTTADPFRAGEPALARPTESPPRSAPEGERQ